MEKSEREWLIPDRVLVAQSRYNLRAMKKKIAQFRGASEKLDKKIDELIAMIGE